MRLRAAAPIDIEGIYDILYLSTAVIKGQKAFPTRDVHGPDHTC